jgi:hypothetical protein
MSRSEGALAAGLALVVFAAHVLSPNVTQGDSRWTVFTAWSLLHEGNADLNEFLPRLEAAQLYGIECVTPGRPVRNFLGSAAECAGGRLYNYYPLGVPLMIAPGVAAMEAVLGQDRPALRSLARNASTGARRQFLSGRLLDCTALVELLLASAVIALATLFLYLYLRASSAWWVALAAALAFAFATPAWSTGSRALWMHGFSMLLLAVAFWALRALASRPWTHALAGGALALAFFVRPTNAAAVACLGVWVLLERRPWTGWFVAGAVPVVALFGALHFGIYGSLLPAYSSVDRGRMPGLSLGPHVPLALAGNLVSPARGLLVYSPFCLFSFWGLWRAIREGRDGRWPWALAGILGLHFGIVCLYEDWFGGDSYGPRYWSDVSPVLAAGLTYAWPRLRSGMARAALAASLVVSVWMHYQGAFCWPCVAWSAKARLERGQSAVLWDWTDPPFLAWRKPPPSPAPE